jgi:hypothetical protein
MLRLGVRSEKGARLAKAQRQVNYITNETPTLLTQKTINRENRQIYYTEFSSENDIWLLSLEWAPTIRFGSRLCRPPLAAFPRRKKNQPR